MGNARTAERSPTTRRPAWLPLAAAGLVVPTALAGLTFLWPGPQIEERLTRGATEALSAAGLASAGVTFSGRDATISGLTGPDGQRAIEIVEDITGVRVAGLATSGTAPSPDPGDGPGAAPAVAAGAVGFALRGTDLVLSGTVGSEEERAALVAAATDQAGGRTVVDELAVTPGAGAPGGLDAAALGAAAGALAGLTGDDLAATVETGADGSPVVALTGTVADDAASAAAQAALEAAVPGATVDNRLTVQAADPAPTSAPAPDSGAGLDAAKAALQSQIDGLLAGAPIGFAPDSPRLTPAGAATVERVLELLTATPGAQLQIDGYVASGPGAGRLTAQELSDQRAATVRDALVAGGVPAGSITAQGRGEGDTPAAQAAGRRVEITVV